MGATESFPLVFACDGSGKMEVGKIILIKARVCPHPTRFSVNLKCENGDIAFHFNPRFDENPQVVVCNTYTEDKWGQEERTFQMPFRQGEYFEMAITIQNSYYEVSVNGEYFLKYFHRLPFHMVTSVEFCGDIEDIKFEDNGSLIRPDPSPYSPPLSNDKEVCNNGKPVDSDKTQRTEKQTDIVDMPEQDAGDHLGEESQVPLNPKQNFPKADSSDQQPEGCCYCRFFVRSFWIRWTKWRIGGDVVVRVNKAV